MLQLHETAGQMLDSHSLYTHLRTHHRNSRFTRVTHALEPISICCCPHCQLIFGAQHTLDTLCQGAVRKLEKKLPYVDTRSSFSTFFFILDFFIINYHPSSLGKMVNHTTLSSKLAIILCVTPHESAARAAPRWGR